MPDPFEKSTLFQSQPRDQRDLAVKKCLGSYPLLLPALALWGTWLQVGSSPPLLSYSFTGGVPQASLWVEIV